MASLHIEDRENNSKTIVENDKEPPASVIEQSDVNDNDTVANKSNQYAEQNIGYVQLPKAEASDAEGSKYQLLEKENSIICETNSKDFKCEPKGKNVCIDQLKKKVVSKYHRKDKVASFNKDQTNNEGEEKSNNLEGKKGQNKGNEDKNKIMFKKKEGTAQVSGQFYETKMLTFIHLGVMFDQDITKFYLASNIDGIGALDDICFRFKSNDNDKDVLVFIQTKHKNRISEKTNITMNDVRKSDGDYSLKKYLISSIKIKEKVVSNKIQTCLFEGDDIHNLDCYYIIYTPAGHSINNNNIKLVKPSSKVNTLIETADDGVVFQFKYEPVDFLLHDLIEIRFEELAKKFLDIILNGNVNMLDDELVECYRTVLLYDVIDVSKDVSEGTHKGKFRSDFFENNQIYTTMFREKLYNEIIQNELHKFAKDKTKLSFSTHDDCVAPNMSKNIGNIIRYDEKSNQFSLVGDNLLNHGQIDQTKEEAKATTAKDVVEMAGKEILKSLEFNIPIEFINKDMQIRNLRRLKFLTSSLIKLFESAKDQNGVKFIEIDENMLNVNKIKRSVFGQNGGLGSAVGNLLKIDQDSKTFKFDCENLPPNAKKLWENLNQKENLTKIKEDPMSYRFKICTEGFPKVSIEDVNSDEYLVKFFLNKLWVYTGQAKHGTVEDNTKKMIKKYLKADSIPESIFEVSPDAVYLILHKTIEKWWENDEEKEYLTKSTTIVDEAISLLMNNPILTVLNLFCVNTLKTIGIEFNKDAMKSLNLDEFTSGLLTIITDSILLTGAKLNQHFSDSYGYIFINLNYAVNHFLFSFDKILHELESKIIKTIVIICEKMENSVYSIQALKRLKQTMHDRKIIIVSNKKTHEEINKDMMCVDVRNDTNNLYDLSLESQEKVLNESIVIFQGVEVNLKTIIDNDLKHIITSQILNKLVNKEVFVLGNALTTSNYEDIKQFYVHRTLECPGETDEDLDEAAMFEDTLKEKIIKSLLANGNKSSNKNRIVVDAKHLLECLNNDMIIVTSPPGMGKSTLLTHLSVETKKDYPNMWIARINLQDYSKQFREWKQNEIVVDTLKTLIFLYQAVTNESRNKKIELAFEDNIHIDEIVSKRDNISVKVSLELGFFIHCCKTGNVIFLFDGFDEICPHYEGVVTQLIKTTIKLNQIDAKTSSTSTIKKPKIWIASRCYNDVLHCIEREFGKFYNLQPISGAQQRIYLKAFWKEYLKLEKFTNKQLSNVKVFIDYMANYVYNYRNKKDFTYYVKPINIPLYDMYAIAVDYFLNEISSVPFLVNKEIFKSTLDIDRSLFNDEYRKEVEDDAVEASMLAATPLNLYIAADFFQNEIKYSNSQPNKWNLDMNTFSFYDRFLKTKFSTILFEGKKKMDLSIPDNEMTHDTAYVIFVEKHQKLAFYTIFSNYESYKAVTTKAERDDIGALVDCIKLAKEKTGVIDCVVDDVPVFIHRTFAEYFAIQHVCNLLKTAYSKKNVERQETIWKFILNAVIKDGTEGINAIFNHKLASDDELLDIIRSEDTEKIVYEIISDQIKTIGPNEEDTAINKAVYCGVRETIKFIFTCIKKHIKEDFDDQFARYARKTSLVEFTYILGYDDVHHLLRDILKMDYELVQSILSRYMWMMRDFQFGPFKRK